jgi:hypothetical protein
MVFINNATLSYIRCPRFIASYYYSRIERRAFFRDDFDRDNFLERLSLLVLETQTICYAWVYMSNNAHFLLHIDPASIADLMRSARAD